MFGYNFNVNNTNIYDMLLDIKSSDGTYHTLSFYNKTGVPSQDDFDIVNFISSEVNKRYLFKIVNTSGKFWNKYPTYDVIYWLMKNRNLNKNVIIDSFYTNPDLKNGSYFVNEMFVKKQIKIIERLTRLDYIVNGGGFGSSSPTTETIFVGIYDDLLKCLDATGNGLSMYITTPFPFETFSYFNGSKMFDLQFVYDLFNSNQKWSNEHFGNYYGVLYMWLNRIHKLGLNIPVYITVNFGFSDVMNYNINKKFDSTYGNWLNYFKCVFPSDDVNFIVSDILDYLKTNILYDDTIKAIFLPYNINNEFNFGCDELNKFRKHLINT